MGSARLPRERRHTLYFLRWIRSAAPVHLDTEVEMSRITEHRESRRATGTRYSVVSYVLHEAGRVLAEHPEANSLVRGGLVPRVHTPASAHGKLALDKTVNGRRMVLATVLADLQSAGLDDIQRQVDRFRDNDPADMPEFAPLWKLIRLPALLGNAAFRIGVGAPRRRTRLLGTFAVTSLGHSVVDGFHSMGGTTVTLGVGRIVHRPVATPDGRVLVAPIMRLSLTFDHRVIDGAEAADVLAELKARLQSFAPPADAAPERRAERVTS
ncbi:2-oxo acid dehydrogenase subunit E2 [Streptomyces sp. NL15-2K]|uniref:2-oxo acid dehydrogenase subunit E2 n=1 Tax=Streptomyces sp. NL15-2K TaxID=376149 RepID=UPI000F560E85|nr:MULTISPECIES: 2-oxo acid dehydrogenase subunit E2 [Actinomycetes]WKX06016.1 2-oxo acid dehydrogenase subunit E2 [Kutzneria buriramensis]GCB53264.1 dihydrolipoamide acetyltransferase component of pyruvate dehydrogenase complex [Streptomyces sp. NL15-2K]